MGSQKEPTEVDEQVKLHFKMLKKEESQKNPENFIRMNLWKTRDYITVREIRNKLII